jgi:hypothetical protein
MEYLDNALYFVLAATFIGLVVWLSPKAKKRGDRTSSGDGWIGDDGDGDGGD